MVKEAYNNGKRGFYRWFIYDEIFNNAGEAILELWTRKEEPLLSLLQNQMPMTEKSVLQRLILMDELLTELFGTSSILYI
jgi:hypothetical protein